MCTEHITAMQLTKPFTVLKLRNAGDMASSSLLVQWILTLSFSMTTLWLAHHAILGFTTRPLRDRPREPNTFCTESCGMSGTRNKWKPGPIKFTLLSVNLKNKLSAMIKNTTHITLLSKVHAKNCQEFYSFWWWIVIKRFLIKRCPYVEVGPRKKMLCFMFQS